MLVQYIDTRRRLFHRDKLGLSLLVLKLKAQEYANAILSPEERDSFKISNGWIEKVSKRATLSSIRLFGEANDMSDAQAEALMGPFRSYVDELCSNNHITMDRVYNADQTGLFHQRRPNRLYCNKDKDFRG